MAEAMSAIVGWELADALSVDGQEALESDGTATVSRVDVDGTVWLRLSGRSEDTPVNGDVLASCGAGDSVRWSIDGTRMSVTGNMSSPSVGMSHVDGAVAPVSEQAMHAGEAASAAQELADSAKSDAARAYDAASAAIFDANRAYRAAESAESSAASALESAETASSMAEVAVSSANTALTNLTLVQDVAGTLQWIQDHCTFALTQDAEIDESKIYFELDDGEYVPVSSPDVADISNYYELTDVDETQAGYVLAHLAVTSAGLWVLPSGIDAATPQASSGYKALLSATGLKVYDPSGDEVATYGTSTVIGRSAQPHVEATSDGVTIYSSSSRKRASVGASGLKVYVGDTAGSETDIASFGEQTRIGAVTGPHVVIDNEGLSVTDDAGSYKAVLHTNLRQVVHVKYHQEYVTSLPATVSVGLYDGKAKVVMAEGPSLVPQSELLVIPTAVESEIAAFQSGSYLYGDPAEEDVWTYSDGVLTIKNSPYVQGLVSDGYRYVLLEYYTLSDARDVLALGSPSYDHTLGTDVAMVGEGVVANTDHSMAIGEWNEIDDYAFAVGNGTADDARSNAFSVDWDGNVETDGNADVSGALTAHGINSTSGISADGSIRIDQNLDGSASGLVIHASNASATGESTATTVWGNLVACYDKADVLRTYLRHVSVSGTQQGLQLETRRLISGSWVYNKINLFIDGSGKRYVTLDDASAWLSALGLSESWTNLPLDSNALAYSSGQAPRYRRFGNVVTLVGAAKPKSQVAAGGTFTVGTLPEGYRPGQEVDTLIQGSGNKVGLLQIMSNGVVSVSRYREGATNAAILTSEWINVDITFMVA